jgi:hypothetical protein
MYISDIIYIISLNLRPVRSGQWVRLSEIEKKNSPLKSGGVFSCSGGRITYMILIVVLNKEKAVFG